MTMITATAMTTVTPTPTDASKPVLDSSLMQLMWLASPALPIGGFSYAEVFESEYQRILTVSGALPAERIMGVETGGCPHTAIREDASINLKTNSGLAEVVSFIEEKGMLHIDPTCVQSIESR